MGILIGSGFYATAKDLEARESFLGRWMDNTIDACNLRSDRLVIVDNSDPGLSPMSCWRTQVIRVHKNLGHNTDFAATHSRLLGWSLSWILPALMAYSERMDFVYKEQDCLAFGDWLPEIRRGLMSVGRHPHMPCEQSLFWISRDFIPDFVAAYMAHPDPDNATVTEDKMMQVAKQFGDAVQFHDLPFGRERPLTFHRDRPWYAQRWTPEELQQLDATHDFSTRTLHPGLV